MTRADLADRLEVLNGMCYESLKNIQASRVQFTTTYARMSLLDELAANLPTILAALREKGRDE